METQEENWQQITNNIPRIVTTKQNDHFIQEITPKEVEKEIMDMPTGKYPRLDGFMTDFYQVCWPIIKEYDGWISSTPHNHT